MIRRVEIEGFRGVSGHLSLECGQVTLLSGPNGFGKTTVFDAIDWCLFGASWRLGQDRDDRDTTRNLYSTVEPLVSLDIELNGRLYKLSRTRSGARLDGRPINDRDLVLTFVRDADVFGPYTRNIEQRVRRLVYLAQADVRDVVSLSPDERTPMLQALLGVPNAALLQSSARRAIERVSQREGEIEDRLDELSEQRIALEITIRGLALSGRSDSQQLNADVQRLLGRELQPFLTMEVVLGLVQEELATCGNEIARLRTVVAAIAQSQERRKSLTAELQLRSRQRETVEERLANATAELKAIEARLADLDLRVRALDESRQKYQAQAKELFDVQAHLAAVRRMREDADLGQQRAKSNQDIADEITPLLVSMKVELAAQVERHEESLGYLEDLSRSLSHAVAVEQQGERLRQVRAEVSDIEGQLEAIRGELARLQIYSKELESRLSTFSGASDRVDAEEEFEISLSRVAALIEEDPTRWEHCPLCGAEYASSNELIDHVRATLFLRSSQASQKQEAARLRNSLAAELEQVTRQTSYAESREGKLQIRRADLLAALETLPPEPSDQVDAGAIRKRLADAQQRVDSVGERRKSLESDLSALDTRLRAASSEAETARRAAAAATQAWQMRLEQIERQGIKVDQVDSSLVELRGALAAVEQDFEQLQEQRAWLQAENDKQLSRVAESISERGRAAAEVLRMEEEIAALREGVLQQASSLMIVEDMADDEALFAQARQRIVEVQEREEQMRAFEVRVKSQLQHEQLLSHSKALDQVSTQEAKLKRSQDELFRAGSKLNAVADALRERAEAEGSKALSRYRASIQACLDALYPHKHLNQVIIENSNGSFMVTDSKLGSRGVRAESYNSTGQLNVLALSIFLGIASTQAITTFDFLLLDEPVQNLDDLHFLALITLLKRLALGVQVVLSTADRNTAELVHRQMESSWHRSNTDFVHYRWRDFSPMEGPNIERVPLRTSAVA